MCVQSHIASVRFRTESLSVTNRNGHSESRRIKPRGAAAAPYTAAFKKRLLCWMSTTYSLGVNH